ncbi:cytochrome c oxidase subunit 8, mitochondrial [Trichomonascus vanleenenianus]|uniref:cytochrome c oxidase subunit VIII n=1 Tax=Trichomonascus vanleenenianus TaxID=2268995 RepID=UPI003ECB2313
MLNRVGLRAAQAVSKRSFTSSAVARSGHHLPEGPYSNLPFKVHGRKFVPYWVLHWSFFVVGLGTPFAMVYYQLKKSG